MHTASAVETNTAPSLEQLSAANLVAIQQEYLAEAVKRGQFISHDQAQHALTQAETDVTQHAALTVNMSAASAARLVRVGSMETYWGYASEITDNLGAIATANGKNHHDEYAAYRQLADDGLRVFAPEDVRPRHPVYAALAGTREIRTGAASEYGNWWIELSDDTANRAVYHFSDSHSSIRKTDKGLRFDTSGVLDAEDALAAKAVSELMRKHNTSLGMMLSESVVMDADPEKVISVNGRGGYIEAAVFDEITLDKIATINAAISDYKEIAEAADVLQESAVPVEKIKLILGEKVEPLVVEWLSPRYNTETTKQAQERPESGLTLEGLNLTAQSSYEEVTEKLNERAAQQWKVVCRALHFLPAPVLQSFKGHSGSWHNYIRDLQRRNTSPETKAKIDDFVAIQQARVFFHDQPAKEQ